MDCIYCQLGASAKTTVRRREYVSARAALAQIRKAVASGQRIDAITFSGSGEPTLNAAIGTIIRGIKRMTAIPVVVLTNSSCLSRPEARRALLRADIVVPSLDAATDAVFRKVNRPHAGLTAAGIIAGLSAFRREFQGQIWLEIMLVRGVNDGPGHLKKLKAAAALIRPDRIQLNTVVRPPAERRAGRSAGTSSSGSAISSAKAPRSSPSSRRPPRPPPGPGPGTPRRTSWPSP